MKEKDEVSWVKNSLLPILRRIGWRRVDFVHGPMEAGRDIIMADYDRFGLMRYYAAQIKDGDLHATSRSPELNSVIDQTKTAFQTPYRDPSSGTEHKIAGVYLIVNGTITDAARNILYSNTGGWLSIVDRSQLEIAQLIGQHLSEDERRARVLAARLEIAFNQRIIQQFLPQLENLPANRRRDINLPIRPLRRRSLERFLEDLGYQELNPGDISTIETLLCFCDMANLILSKLSLGPMPLEVGTTPIDGLLGSYKIYWDSSGEIEEGLLRLLDAERPAPGARFKTRFFPKPKDDQGEPETADVAAESGGGAGI